MYLVVIHSRTQSGDQEKIVSRVFAHIVLAQRGLNKIPIAHYCQHTSHDVFGEPHILVYAG